MSNFQFKYFSIRQDNSALKVGSDAMILGASIPANLYQNILDIGTGTGVLALMVKQVNPKAKITAIDIDAHSLMDCQFNFENSPWPSDLFIQQCDFRNFEPTKPLDCIICNPPYYENGLQSSTERNNQAKHASEELLEELFLKSNEFLTETGDFWVILPYSSAEKWISFAQKNKLFLHQKISVYGKPMQAVRSILGFSKVEKKTTTRELTIRNSDNSYTEQYKLLTLEFHNKKL